MLVNVLAVSFAETSADCSLRHLFFRWCDRKKFLVRQKKISVAPALKRVYLQTAARDVTHLHVRQAYTMLFLLKQVFIFIPKLISYVFQ